MYYIYKSITTNDNDSYKNKLSSYVHKQEMSWAQEVQCTERTSRRFNKNTIVSRSREHGGYLVEWIINAHELWNQQVFSYNIAHVHTVIYLQIYSLLCWWEPWAMSGYGPSGLASLFFLEAGDKQYVWKETVYIFNLLNFDAASKLFQGILYDRVVEVHWHTLIYSWL